MSSKKVPLLLWFSNAEEYKRRDNVDLDGAPVAWRLEGQLGWVAH
jgi:hypothetical protein